MMVKRMLISFVQETWTMLHENMTKKIIINDERELNPYPPRTYLYFRQYKRE